MLQEPCSCLSRAMSCAIKPVGGTQQQQTAAEHQQQTAAAQHSRHSQAESKTTSAVCLADALLERSDPQHSTHGTALESGWQQQLSTQRGLIVMLGVVPCQPQPPQSVTDDLIRQVPHLRLVTPWGARPACVPVLLPG